MVHFLKQRSIELGVKYKLKFPSRRMLSPIGIEALRHAIDRNTGLGYTYTDILSTFGVDEVIPKMTAKDAYGDDQQIGGNLLNRIEKYMRIRYGRQLTKDAKQNIGNAISNYWIGGEKQTLYIDFTNIIDWQSGKFGEKSEEYGNSCWWNTPAKETFSNYLQADKGFATRLFLEQPNGLVGIGRVWAIMTRSEYPVLFNGYGWTLERWADRLADFFNEKEVHRVNLYISPSFMYVNNETGFFIGPKAKSKEVYEFNLGDYVPKVHYDDDFDDDDEPYLIPEDSTLDDFLEEQQVRLRRNDPPQPHLTWTAVNVTPEELQEQIRRHWGFTREEGAEPVDESTTPIQGTIYFSTSISTRTVQIDEDGNLRNVPPTERDDDNA